MKPGGTQLIWQDKSMKPIGMIACLLLLGIFGCSKDPLQSIKTFKDSRDGHLYKSVKIGTQTWMAENLAYLPSVSPSANSSETSPYYYVYGYQGNDVNAAKIVAGDSASGVLYNWPAAMISCPAGWHLPTDAEWTVLTDYLAVNGYGCNDHAEDIGKSMASVSGWSTSLEPGAVGNDRVTNNRSGFAGYPSGYSSNTLGFKFVGEYAQFWSATEYNSSVSWIRYLYYQYNGVYRLDFFKWYGQSVRCLKNK